ncbi:alanine racemase domain-containing protein [Actinobacillus equuli]|nr:alanine racemase domain-containing protein [Actinobacillus equuli]
MSISQNLSQINQQIQQISQQFNRTNVRLLAVSKTKPVEAIEEAISAGQTAFGEIMCRKVWRKLLILLSNQI